MATRSTAGSGGPIAGAPPLSSFGALVSQLSSLSSSSSPLPPSSPLCFDLLSQLGSALDAEPASSIQIWQRQCEDALVKIVTAGARRPVRRRAAAGVGRVIERGDGISVYSRASGLQGFLADGKKTEPLACAGAAQCLGELYRLFGRKITGGLVETTSIVSKLMKFNEDYVRQDALLLLENALEGSGGGGGPAAYTESFKIIMKMCVTDKSFIVRLAGARCLKTFGSVGWIGLGFAELDNSMAFCVKGLEDQVSSVRDAFAEALGALLALAMNPDAQVKMKKGKNQTPTTKKQEDSLHKYLIAPFIKASGANAKNLRIGLVLSWVFFLQVIHLKYHFAESELQNFALKAIEMLQSNGSTDPHALACVLYILRVGVADQLTEPAQRDFLVLLGRKLESLDYSPSMRVATLRILSYLLKSLGEVPSEFKDVLDNTVVSALSHTSVHVRVEAALTLCSLAEVDPTCVGGLVSLGVTTLHALREIVSFDRGNNNLSVELASLHGQATVLAALVAISPKLLLGYPARLSKSVFEVSNEMLNTVSRNPVGSAAVKEAGWLLLASLVSSMPKEELEDQAFDILLLWAGCFAGNPEYYMRTVQDWVSELRVLSVAIEALTAFIKSYIFPETSSSNSGILLQPVLAYLSGALSLISLLCAKPPPNNVKPALDLFTARVLMAYQSIPDPLTYKSDHAQIMRLCSSPFGDPSGWEESSLLRVLLDKRDACLGPWIPGRDSFEDELRAFDGGIDGILPCVWDDEIGNFPQPESVSKMLVNQMLSCFGTVFACQENREKVTILNRIEQCLKTGKRQAWYLSFVTNSCVGLLSGLKSVLALRPQALSVEILNTIQSIFQAILVESDDSAQRRAACEGLGLLARLANDAFTARMTRSLLGELSASIDPNYSGSIALSLGCIHRSAGGMALSVLVPSTVNAISTLCKSSNSALQLWSLHALLLTIEAAGLSYVPQVQATLLLVMEILLLDENGYVDLRQEIGQLINAIVAVIGPELSPGSTFFSRCQSVIAEISSCNETAALVESVRFTQQLVLFAPQAATVHSHVQNLIPTLFSRQPSLRHLAVSTLRHLIERDPDEMIKENIEENLFSMLDEETDSEIANLVRTTINRLLTSSCPQCPSRWLTILRNMVLATSQGRIESQNDAQNGENESDLYYNDDQDMISSSKQEQNQQSSVNTNFTRRNKYLRYRTRVFAAECLSCVPNAVGTDPAHFDLTLARNQISNDWLVLKLQDLVSLSYQISTGQFEGMQPTGVRLLSVIMDKFGNTPDPEFPGHILLEQYQAQLVSAVRSTINTSSGPLLLDAGLELATKILTSSIVGGDRVALNRLFLLISRPLSEIQDLCYPSFADWVACKIKVRILTAHASVKCYTYQFFKKEKEIPGEYLQLVPLLSDNSAQLGKFWIGILKDYIYIIFNSHLKSNYKPFLDGIDSPLVSSKVDQYLKDSWHLILQSTALDSVPIESCTNTDINDQASFISGRNMVGLSKTEFQFIWGLAMLVLFRCEGQNGNFAVFKEVDEGKLREVCLSVFLCLTKEGFFGQEFVSVEMCKELLQALVCVEPNDLVVSLLSQIVQKCPNTFFETESFVFSAMQLFSRCLVKIFQSYYASSENLDISALLSELSIASEAMMQRTKYEHKWKFATSLISLSYQSYVKQPTNLCLSKVISFLHNILPLLNKKFKEDSELHSNIPYFKSITSVWASTLTYFSKECVKMINLENKSSELSKFFAKILVFSLQETACLTQLVYETHNCLLERETNDFGSLVSSLLTHSSECFSSSLSDSNSMVQILGLHALKTLAQRELAKGAQSKSSYFTLLLGELLQDIFDLLHNTLKRCESKEEVTVIEECLKLLFLFFTLVQNKEYQKDVTMLLLEAFLLVFSLSKSSDSQELGEANNVTRRLVSHFVQIPLAATQIKDIMLSVPAEKRQELQDMIRVSVGQGQTATFATSNVEPANSNDNNNNNDDDEFEDDDWDAFQSLPATNNNNNNNNNNEIFSENEELNGENVQKEITDAINQESESTSLENNHASDELIMDATGKEGNEASNEKHITNAINQESELTNIESNHASDEEIIIDSINKDENEASNEENNQKENIITVETNQESESVSTEKDESQESEIPETSQESIVDEIIENQNINLEPKEGNVGLIIEEEEFRSANVSSIVESGNVIGEKIEQFSEDKMESLDNVKVFSDQNLDNKEKDELNGS